jgi:hypothetical protein
MVVELCNDRVFKNMKTDLQVRLGYVIKEKIVSL